MTDLNKQHLTPIKAIRQKCLDCTCFQPKEIRTCGIKACSLWSYRMGHRPKKEADSSTIQEENNEEAVNHEPD